MAGVVVVAGWETTMIETTMLGRRGISKPTFEVYPRLVLYSELSSWFSSPRCSVQNSSPAKNQTVTSWMDLPRVQPRIAPPQKKKENKKQFKCNYEAVCCCLCTS